MPSSRAVATGLATLAGGVALGRSVAYRHHPRKSLADCISELRPVPPPAGAATQRVAAIFDVDGALYAVPGDPTGGGTAIMHMLLLARDYSALRANVVAALLFPLILMFFIMDKTDRVVSMFTMMSITYNRVPVRVVEEYMRRFCASAFFGNMIVHRTRARLRSHVAQGDLVILLSASPMQVTGPLAEYFGAHVACGSLCDTEVRGADGERYFSRAQHQNVLLVGEEKEKLLKLLVERYNIDTARSYGYGDHPTDLPVLAMVGHPIVANPTKAMRKIAEQRQWEILEHEEAETTNPWVRVLSAFAGMLVGGKAMLTSSKI